MYSPLGLQIEGCGEMREETVKDEPTAPMIQFGFFFFTGRKKTKTNLTSAA